MTAKPGADMFYADDYDYADDGLTVCVTHLCFVPCRRAEGCKFADDDASVDMVRDHQTSRA